MLHCLPSANFLQGFETLQNPNCIINQLFARSQDVRYRPFKELKLSSATGNPRYCIRHCYYKILQQSELIQDIASKILHPRYCIRGIASEILHPRHCIQDIASEILHPRCCIWDIASEILHIRYCIRDIAMTYFPGFLRLIGTAGRH